MYLIFLLLSEERFLLKAIYGLVSGSEHLRYTAIFIAIRKLTKRCRQTKCATLKKPTQQGFFAIR